MEESCLIKEYEYSFIYDNQEYIANDCTSGRFGTSCKKDGIIYKNVSYKATVIGCKEEKNNNLNYLDKVMIFASIFLIIYLLIRELINKIL